MALQSANRHARPLALAAVAAALCALGTGCSSIPTGRKAPESLGGDAGAPIPMRIAVAPCTVELDKQEKPKGYEPDEVVDADAFSEELVRWVQASGVFAEVRGARGKTRVDQLDDAWEQKEDLLLEVALKRFKVNFDGHNNWWIPNIVNWVMFLFPSWFVATEEYTLSFTCELTLRSVDSNQVLHTAEVKASATGTFDEFDRGFQLLGFIFPNNDAENWRMVAGRLLSAARSNLGELIAQELRSTFRERLKRDDVRSKMTKTMALVLGVTHYQDAERFPPVPFAGADARRIAEALHTNSGLPKRLIATRVGSEATRGNAEKAIAELNDRARSGDQLLVYFAGYGFRNAEGDGHILLNDLSGASSLSLKKLGELLKDVEGEKLIVLDCAFDGQNRSQGSKKGSVKTARAEAEALSKVANATVVLSTQPGSSCQAPAPLEAGLFTHHLAEGLAGAADQDEDGNVTHAELFAFASKRTRMESAYFGNPQSPLVVGEEDHPFKLRVETPAPAETESEPEPEVNK